MNLAYRPETPDGVGTLLVSARPFTRAELAQIDRLASDVRFQVMFTPARSEDATFDRLTGPGARECEASYSLRINAPTDDSPFFFNMLRWRDIFSLSVLNARKQSNNLKAIATLGILLGTVLVLTVFCILVPLWASRGRDVGGAGPLLVFVVCIGLGFMLVETSQMQRLIIALGHPTYALSVVLFVLLLSSGLGSYLTAEVPAERLAAIGGRRLLMLVGILTLFGAITPAVVRASAAASTPARTGCASSGCAHAVVVGPERRRLGARLRAERLHRAQLVDFGRFLDRLPAVRRRVRRVPSGRRCGILTPLSR